MYGARCSAGLVLILATAGLAVGPHRARTAAAQVSTPMPPRFDGERALEHLRKLVAIGPRPAGSPAARETRAYITRQLSALGFTVEEQPFTAESPYGPVEMANLIVTLHGRRPERLLIGGHYDTKLMPTARFVGANDGASSAALLIELARALRDRPHEFTIELISFDGEEAFVDWKGLDHTYGSRFYVQSATKANAIPMLKALILVDMVGNRDLRICRDRNSTRWLNELIWSAANRVGHGEVFVDAETAVEDDHQPFIAAGVPAVDLIDLDDATWHTPNDDLAHVSAASLQAVGDVLLAALPDLEARLASRSPGLP